MINKIKFLLGVWRSLSSAKKAFRNDFKTAPSPVALHFETTYACTCKCTFCDRWVDGSRNIGKELSYSQIISMIDQAYSLGVRIISLSGGEPLLKKGILKAMKYARNKGMITNVTHNGTLINQKNVKDVLDSFDVVNISLDSLDREKHDKLRGVKGTFDKALKSLKLLKKHSRHTVIGIQSILTSENADDLARINRIFSKKGFHTYFQPIHDNSDNKFNVSDKSLKDFGRKGMENFSRMIKSYHYPGLISKFIYRKYFENAANFIVNPDSTKKCFNCLAGSMSLFVNPYGEVFPCDPVRMSMGNLKKNSLKKIWNSKKSVAARKMAKNRGCHCWLLCSAPVYINASRFVK